MKTMRHQNAITSLSFYRFKGPAARLWAFTQMAFARPAMAKLPGVGFWKLFGSGSGEGFTPIPNTGVYGILATFPSLQDARHAIEREAVFKRYRDHAVEHWTVYLSTTSVRGQWSGQTPFRTAPTQSNGPLAALTRATIRPRVMLKFWQRVPSISTAIGQDQNVTFKIGLGEVPWFQQVTFSIWPNAESMAQFARKDGPHARAIHAVREGKWFAEELYARFDIVDQQGSWNGSDPVMKTRRTITA